MSNQACRLALRIIKCVGWLSGSEKMSFLLWPVAGLGVFPRESKNPVRVAQPARQVATRLLATGRHCWLDWPHGCGRRGAHHHLRRTQYPSTRVRPILLRGDGV
jgi:hypothetical protein